MSNLDTLRLRAQGVASMVILALAILAPVTSAIFAASHLVTVAIMSALVAGLALANWRLSPNTPASRSATAAALIAFPALFVFMLSGSPWQIDMHMMFFASLAICAIMLDWRAIVAASAVPAVHHLSLNFFLPWAVFPEGANFLRVVFHAVIVVGQAAALIWMTHQAAKALSDADLRTSEADKAREDAASSSEQASTARSNAERQRQDIAALAEQFEIQLRQVAKGISGASGQVDTLARQLGSDAEETRLSASEAVSQASSTNSDVQSVAAAAQELSASISEVARILENSSGVSERAVAEAEGAGRSVEQLESAATEIESIMKLVADVAEQTNLLALNATIEAARAGEAGKGFAVVASEVKALAEQTTRASNDIATRIESMRGASSGAAVSLGRIAEIIAELRGATDSVQDAFTQQDQATREIAELAEKAAAATSRVNDSMDSVSDAAARTSGAAESFAQASNELNGSARQLDEELDRFRQSLGAA